MTPGRQWVDGSAVVALESKTTLLLAILNKAVAINTIKCTGEELALGLISQDLILCRGRGDSWPQVQST